MTEAEYNEYKERVLAKCDGANIHRVRNLLGSVINTIVILNGSEKHESHIWVASQHKAIVEIAQRTGVHP